MTYQKSRSFRKFPNRILELNSGTNETEMNIQKQIDFMGIYKIIL